MDTGNPWDSKPLAASPTETTIENAFSAQNPKVDEGWADFTNNKDPSSPTKAKPTEESWVWKKKSLKKFREINFAFFSFRATVTMQ